MGEPRTVGEIVERLPQPSNPTGVAEGGDPLLRLIERAANDPAFDVEKMERLVAMHERALAQRAAVEFDTAMAEAQRECTPICEDANNPQTKSKYATYLALDCAVRPIYTRHGFSISYGQGSGAPENYIKVEAYVSRAGHSRTYWLDMPADGKGAKGGDVMTKTHATGSALTYGRRYLLVAIFNLAIGEMHDDDGNAASGHEPLTPAHKEELVALIKETGADTAAFLKYLFPRAPVKSLDEMPDWKFEDARAALLKKKGKGQ